MNKRLYYYARKYISWIIPKKKNYYVFWPTLSEHKFEGNVKALILFIKKNRREIDTTLISESTSILKTAREHGLDVTRPITVKGLWSILRAEYIFIDASNSGEFTFGRFDLIQLWHGSGYKDVGLKYKRNKDRLDFLLKIYNKFKLIAATSESDAHKQNLSFGKNVSVVTGYPRNDMFFQKDNNAEKLKKHYGLERYNEVILYAPTHRDRVFKQIEAFSNAFWEDLQQYLEKKNILFVIKRHPKDDSLIIPSKHSNIKDWTTKISDVQEFLLVADLLITDYSSIATDFAITSKPLMIYAYDFDKYIKQVRSMYYDLENVLPQPIIKTEHKLLEKLKNRQWLEEAEYQDSYKMFRRTFHEYPDGNSSRRVVEAVKKL